MENTLPATQKNGFPENNPDLLGTIAQQNGNKSGKQIATQEIIRQDAQRNGFDPKQVLETVAKLKLSNKN